YLFVAALWCGALVAFAAGGARIVLHPSPTRQAGGAVNRALLDALDVASYAALALLVVLFLLIDRATPLARMPRAFTIRLLVVALAATIVSHLLVTPELAALRDRMGGVLDAVPPGDALRQQWGRLHALSVFALLLRIAA